VHDLKNVNKVFIHPKTGDSFVENME
jgi:hypothetical protein